MLKVLPTTFLVTTIVISSGCQQSSINLADKTKEISEEEISLKSIEESEIKDSSLELNKNSFNTKSATMSINGFYYPQCTATADTFAYQVLGKKLTFDRTSGRDAKYWISYVKGLQIVYSLKNGDYAIGVQTNSGAGHVFGVKVINSTTVEITESNVPLGSGTKTYTTSLNNLSNLHGMKTTGYLLLKSGVKKSYGYKVVKSKTTNGSSSFGRNVIGASSYINSSNITVDVSKKDWASYYPTYFKNPSVIELKVGSPESYGVNWAKVNVPIFSFGTTFNVDLNQKEWPENRKSIFVRVTNKDGWAKTDEMIIERFEK